MKNHRMSKWAALFGIALCLAGTIWITCTKKFPLDPTDPIGKEFYLLINMTASQSSLQTGGQKTVIQVRLINDKGESVSGRGVAFQIKPALGSLIPAQSNTDEQGWASTELASGGQTGTATITAQYQNLASSSVSIQFVEPGDTSAVQLQLVSDEQEILANGISTAVIKVGLIGKQSYTGSIVTLTSTKGIIPASVVIGSDGTVKTTLTSTADTQDATATVTAVYKTNTVSLNVLLKGVDFHIEASPAAIFADGTSVSTIKAVLRETKTGIGLPTQTVQFGSTLGTIPAQKNTDVSGIASVSLTSGTVAGKAVVTGYYGKTLTDTVHVTLQKPLFDFDITPESNAMLANGTDKMKINVVVRDAQNQPLANTAVSFEANLGTIDRTALTNASGTATASLTAPADRTDRTATVTVTVGGVGKTAQILCKGLIFDMVCDPNYLVADGSSQSIITATIKEATSRIGISGARVQFGTSLGTIPSEAVTNSEGLAQAKLTSGKVTGTAEVIARYANLFLDTVAVQMGSSVPPGVADLSASPKVILANGSDVSTITALVIDQTQKPVGYAAVNFTASAGQIVSQGMTSSVGIATVELVSSESTTDVVSTVTARVGTQSKTVQVTFEGIQMTASASPTGILADGHSTSAISVVLKKTTSKIAVPNARISFATDLGTIPSEVYTNSQGVAQALLTSGSTVGTAHVTAQYCSSIKQTVPVSFQESIPTYLEVTATPPVLPADGQSQSVIKAMVSDANRNPVPNGTLVTFRIVSGSGTLPQQATTVGGVASVTLTSGNSPGTTSILITVGSLNYTQTVTYIVGDVSQVLVTSSRETLPADGITNATIQAQVMDAQGNPVPGVIVTFSASIGDVTPSVITNAQGVATAQYSSGTVGTATITASVTRSGGNKVTGIKIIQLLPGNSNSINLRFNPESMGVKDTGQNQTVTVFADVKDSKNNPVVDGTLVRFQFMGASLGAQLSSAQPVPTVGGTAQVSITSGTVSGSIRIRAEILNAQQQSLNPPVTATSTQLIIHAGPPFMEDIHDLATTHLTVLASRMNIWRGLDTTEVAVMVGDKYNNPVEEGTAVYLTTSGGVVSTHTAYTDKLGKATVILTGGNPQPTINRFYNYIGMQDPNLGTTLPGPYLYWSRGDSLLPNFEAPPDFYGSSTYPSWGNYPAIEGGFIPNNEGNTLENEGVSRIMAYTIGMDVAGNQIRPWDWHSVVMSGLVRYADNSAQSLKGRTLYIGQSATVMFSLMDDNGNPIEANTTLTAEVVPAEVPAALNWTEVNTGWGHGTCYYYITIYNKIDPENPKPGACAISIHWNGNHQFGTGATESVYIALSPLPTP